LAFPALRISGPSGPCPHSKWSRQAPTSCDGANRPKSRNAEKQRHPCTARSQPGGVRAQLCVSARPAMREARALAGQLRYVAPSGSAAGKSVSIDNSRSPFPTFPAYAPDRFPDGPRHGAWFATANRAGCRQAAPDCSGLDIGLPPMKEELRRGAKLPENSAPLSDTLLRAVMVDLTGHPGFC
jgi:hypothetical protein